MNKPEKTRFEALGDRMKQYESAETGRRLMPGLPVIVRLDGRSFHNFTKDMPRPFHLPMSRCMIETARHLVKETHPVFAYTQSDEITLVFYDPDPLHEMIFGGRIQKITSVLAGLATAKFNQSVFSFMPEKSDRLPVFDARVFNVPTLEEAAQCILFRTVDCQKNSITMAASAYYPHQQLHGIGGPEKHEMLRAKGINWADYPTFFKDGTFLRRVTKMRMLTPQEMERIPVAHRPDGAIARSHVEEIDMPPFCRIANKVDVLFSGAFPQLFPKD